MKIIGLTGGIGSGKSTVARMLGARGARLIDADELARQVVEPGRPAYKEIVEEFGREVLNPDGSINRSRLAALVFGNEKRRQRLNEITHPRIGEEMLRLLRQYQEEGAELTVIDAALLLESPATKWIRPVIVVVCPDEIKAARVGERDQLSPEEVLARIRSQWSDEQRAALADYVIDNSAGLAELEEQVERVWQAIRSGGEPTPTTPR